MTSPYFPHNDGKSIIFRQCRLTNRRDLLQCGYDNDHVTMGYFLERYLCWLLSLAVGSLILQDRQATLNRTFRRVRATIVAVEKQ